MVAWILLVAGPRNAYSTPTDYEVKAVFLYNFAQFIDWPANIFTNQSSPMVIGILGEDPFGSTLDDAVKDETVHGRKIVIKRFSAADDLRTCQILFISQSEKDRVVDVLQELKASPVVTVSEVEQFCEHGGMINFVRQDQNVRLEVNRASAEAVRVKISSQLLGLARLVKTATSGERAKP